ncbi:uncharacterized protein LOC114279572 isoform X4 [Camellia sinensis]|uniref:uncharacterized protein LOC114279572 isoform X4 n=1 Tax=Camellia sinensis TaxID=4442 RepID=UPI0010360A11|nr:uncharacterized protein LOC114279572 isoform X4 [Camellia sinensis]
MIHFYLSKKEKKKNKKKKNERTRRTKECSVNSPDYGSLPLNSPEWCLAPFDPEGILSSLMAAITCVVGLHYGHIIVHFKAATLSCKYGGWITASINFPEESSATNIPRHWPGICITTILCFCTSSRRKRFS